MEGLGNVSTEAQKAHYKASAYLAKNAVKSHHNSNEQSQDGGWNSGADLEAVNLGNIEHHKLGLCTSFEPPSSCWDTEQDCLSLEVGKSVLLWYQMSCSASGGDAPTCRMLVQKAKESHLILAGNTNLFDESIWTMKFKHLLAVVSKVANSS